MSHRLPDPAMGSGTSPRTPSMIITVYVERSSCGPVDQQSLLSAETCAEKNKTPRGAAIVSGLYYPSHCPLNYSLEYFP